jgi:hypothetical protein
MPEDVWQFVRGEVLSAGGECGFSLREDDD